MRLVIKLYKGKKTYIRQHTISRCYYTFV